MSAAAGQVREARWLAKPVYPDHRLGAHSHQGLVKVESGSLEADERDPPQVLMADQITLGDVDRDLGGTLQGETIYTTSAE